jgi:hypothetical protein
MCSRAANLDELNVNVSRVELHTFSEHSLFHFCFVLEIGSCNPYLDAVRKMLNSLS